MVFPCQECEIKPCSPTGVGGGGSWGWSLGQWGGTGGHTSGRRLHSPEGETPSPAPWAALRGDPDGDTWRKRGGVGSPAGESRASNRQVRDKTRQKLMAPGKPRRKSREGAILLFQQTLAGGGWSWSIKAAPGQRPGPWAPGWSVAPQPPRPHLSPQEHRVLTNPTLSPSHRVPGAWRGYLGHWPAQEATVAAAHHPDIQVPPDRGRGSSKLRAGPPPGALPGLKETAGQAARSSVLGPLASCCPSPSSGHSTLPSPPRLQEAAWHRSRP